MNLTKSQQRVVLLLADGARIRSALSGWVLMPNRIPYPTMPIEELKEQRYVKAVYHRLHYWLELTPRGREVAAELKGDSDDK